MPTPFGIPRYDPKETYEAPAVTNGLWENDGFRVGAEHLRLRCFRFTVDNLYFSCTEINYTIDSFTYSLLLSMQKSFFLNLSL